MASHVLVVRAASFDRPRQIAAAAGGLAVLAGAALLIWASPIAGGVLLLVGIGLFFGLWMSMRTPAIRFDRQARTIERLGGPAPGPLGTFNDYDGVDVVGRVNEDVARGTALHEVHRTYPGKDLIVYDVCLVGDDGPTPLLSAPSRRHATEVQQEIVQFVGWTRQSTTIPDSKRLLS